MAIDVGVREHKFLLDGRWVDSSERLEVKSPQGGSIEVTYLADADQVEDGIRSAVRTFEIMKAMPSYKRAEILGKIAQGIKNKREAFARSITLEAGKPIKDSRLEVDRAVLTFTIASEEAKRLPGEAIPLDLNQANEGRVGIVRRFPIGPVLGITPFNFPLNLVAHKIAPALAAGNTIIIKPSPRTPLTSLLLAEVAVEAGVPAGALNVVPCSTELTRKMAADARIKMLTFTGSDLVGWELKALAGKKKVALELGGNAAIIVDSDADLEYAVSKSAAGAYYYAGQSCISVQRIFVHRSRYSEFLEKYVGAVKSRKLGDPMEEATDIGPVIDEASAKRIEEWIDEAVEGGADLLTGGHRNGTFVEPAVLTGVDPKAALSCLEAFGPVSIVEPFEAFDGVIRRVNDSKYGLQTGIFSNNLRHVFQAFNELEVGQVVVNESSNWRVDHMPYGGIKDSGFGREGIRYAIEEMTEIKLLAINPK